MESYPFWLRQGAFKCNLSTTRQPMSLIAHSLKNCQRSSPRRTLSIHEERSGDVSLTGLAEKRMFLHSGTPHPHCAHRCLLLTHAVHFKTPRGDYKHNIITRANKVQAISSTLQPMSQYAHVASMRVRHSQCRAAKTSQCLGKTRRLFPKILFQQLLIKVSIAPL